MLYIGDVEVDEAKEEQKEPISKVALIFKN
jgi:hypothetical protein